MHPFPPSKPPPVLHQTPTNGVPPAQSRLRLSGATLPTVIIHLHWVLQSWVRLVPRRGARHGWYLVPLFYRVLLAAQSSLHKWWWGFGGANCLPSQTNRNRTINHPPPL